MHVPNTRPAHGPGAPRGHGPQRVQRDRPDRAIVTCQVVNRATPRPAITLKKFTNGEDADIPPGPFVPLTTNGQPTPITWTYRVTNTGNVTLNGVTVTDNPGVVVTCPKSTLAPGEPMSCLAQGVVADPATLPGGLYTNVGSVSATDGSGTTVTGTDLSHYTPVAPGISVIKSINGLRADDIPGVFLGSGVPITFSYLVSNTGTSPLDTIVLTDDVLGPITCPATTLAVGGSMTCTAAGTAQPGFNENVATVTGRDTVLGATVVDTDPANYFGEAPAITLVKTTNTEDANTPPGPLVAVGAPVFWTYTVTNTGNVPLRWQVTDDQGVAPVCPTLLFIVPTQSVTCHATGTAAAGQYANIGTVVGTTESGRTVTATDPSHYFGEQGGIGIVKLTNGDDANDPPGPLIPVGGPVTWTYRVTNTGNTALTNVTVTDSRGVTITCPADTLDLLGTMDCTATGSAEAGQYTNDATAQGTTSLGVVVEAQDPSAYFGAEPSISIIKATNGVSAPEPPGPFIRVGAPVEWGYLVVNTGNSTLSGITVTDDQGVVVTCPQAVLAAGEQMGCTATGVAAEGQYANVGTVTGQDPTGATRHRLGLVALPRRRHRDRGAQARQRRGGDGNAGTPDPGRLLGHVDLHGREHGQRGGQGRDGDGRPRRDADLRERGHQRQHRHRSWRGVDVPGDRHRDLRPVHEHGHGDRLRRAGGSRPRHRGVELLRLRRGRTRLHVACGRHTGRHDDALRRRGPGRGRRAADRGVETARRHRTTLTPPARRYTSCAPSARRSVPPCTRSPLPRVPVGLGCSPL